MYPRIDSPCPLKTIQFPEQGNFSCSVCSREVHDLSAMSERQRYAFLRQCSGEVCVSYKVKAGLQDFKKGLLAGAFVVSASGLAVAVAADPANTEIVQKPQASEIIAEDIGVLPDEMSEIVLVGGVHVPDADEDESLDEKRTLQLIHVVEERDE